MNRYLYCSDCIEDGNYIWFSSNSHNGLYRIDKKKNKAELILRFPGEEVLGKNLHSKVLRWGEQLIFVPCSAKEIAVYHYKSNIIKKLSLQDMKGTVDDGLYEGMKFTSADLYGNNVWFWGTGYPAVVRLNLLTEELIYYKEWRKWISPKAERGAMFTNAVIREKNGYAPFFCEDAVLKINLDTGSMERIPVSFLGTGFYWAADDGVDLWFIETDSRSLVRWDPDTGLVKEIKLPYKGKSSMTPFQSPIVNREKVYLFPNGTCDVYVIDRKTNTVNIEEKLTGLLNAEKEDVAGIFEASLNPQILSDRYLRFIRGKDFSWHIYDVYTGRDSFSYWKMEEEDYKDIEKAYIRKKLRQDHFITEDQDASLSSFLNCLNDEWFSDLCAET